MKKLFTLLVALATAACTYYPLGMSEAEWNALSKDERVEAHREEARLREQRRLRYAIERQNRLKEERIKADIAASKATAQSAATAAASAQAASQSAAIAQQNAQNTSVNNITVNPNIIVSNTNDNSGTIAQNKNVSKKYIAKEEKKNPYFKKPKKPKEKDGRKAEFSKKKKCEEYHIRITQGDRLLKKKEYRLAQKAYKRAYRKACTNEQEKIANEKAEEAKNLKNANLTDNKNDDNCKQYDHFMEKGNAFMKDKKHKQAADAYEKAISFACSEDKKMEAKTSMVNALNQ